MCFGDTNYWQDEVVDSVVMPEVVATPGPMTIEDVVAFTENNAPSFGAILDLFSTVLERGIEDEAKETLRAALDAAAFIVALTDALGDFGTVNV